jgi:hypothetical protein
MSDPDLVKVGLAGLAAGWTALLAWNLKETVSNGKDIVALKVKIENGLTTGLTELKDQIAAHIDGEEARLLSAMRTTPKRKRKS